MSQGTGTDRCELCGEYRPMHRETKVCQRCFFYIVKRFGLTALIKDENYELRKWTM